MANPNFNPTWSTNDIYRGTEDTICLTDDLDAIEADILALELEKAHVEHTHTGYAATAHTHDDYAAAAHTHAQSDITGLGTAMADKADLVNGKIPESQLPSYVDDVAEYDSLTDFPSAGETSKIYLAKDTNKAYRWGGSVYVEIAGGVALGETAATAHRGDHGKIAYDHSQTADVHVTSAQKTSWDSKAAGDHAHDNLYAKKEFQVVSDSGSFRYSYRVVDNKNILDEIKNMPTGMHTVYSQTGVTNNPKNTEAWRMLVHKTGNTVVWVKAFGSAGSEYSNYCADGVWQGWRCVYDVAPVPLWTGGYYMHGTQNVYPNKPLAQCRNGWMLEWSNYDITTGEPTDGDVVFTYIPKKCYDGNEWSGHSHLCMIPIDTESFCIKKLYIWPDRLSGNAVNNQAPRNNAVLRAVYEF